MTAEICTCTTDGYCNVCRPEQPRRPDTLKDSLEWAFGQWGEHEVRQWLEAAGKFVIPTSCIEDGGAPALTRLLERVVLPDFQAFNAEGGGWWEVKTKRAPIYYQKMRQHRHGIDEVLWHQYLEVERVTGLPGYLAIVQLEQPMLLAQSFQVLEKWAYAHEGSTAAYRGSRLVYWDVNDFEQVISRTDLAKLIDVDAAPPPPPIERIARPWDHKPNIGPQQPRLWDDL